MTRADQLPTILVGIIFLTIENVKPGMHHMVFLVMIPVRKAVFKAHDQGDPDNFSDKIH